MVPLSVTPAYGINTKGQRSVATGGGRTWSNDQRRHCRFDPSDQRIEPVPVLHRRTELPRDEAATWVMSSRVVAGRSRVRERKERNDDRVAPTLAAFPRVAHLVSGRRALDRALRAIRGVGIDCPGLGACQRRAEMNVARVGDSLTIPCPNATRMAALAEYPTPAVLEAFRTSAPTVASLVASIRRLH